MYPGAPRGLNSAPFETGSENAYKSIQGRRLPNFPSGSKRPASKSMPLQVVKTSPNHASAPQNNNTSEKLESNARRGSGNQPLSQAPASIANNPPSVAYPSD